MLFRCCLLRTAIIMLSNFLYLVYLCSCLQSWTKPNVTPKNLRFIFPLPPFPAIQCCRLVVVGALAENSSSRCLSHSLINIEWGGRGDCRSVTLILPTIVWKLKKSEKSLLLKTIKPKFIFEISLNY